MEKNQFSAIMTFISQIYGPSKFNFPTGNKNLDQAKSRAWYSVLGGFDFEVVMGAVKKYIATGAEWPPNPGQILKLMQGENITGPEAYALAMEAASFYGMYRQEEARKSLPVVVWTAIEHMGGYRTLCMSQAGDTFFMNRFLQVFDIASDKIVTQENVERIEYSSENARVQAMLEEKQQYLSEGGHL